MRTDTIPSTRVRTCRQYKHLYYHPPHLGRYSLLTPVITRTDPAVVISANMTRASLTTVIMSQYGGRESELQSYECLYLVIFHRHGAAPWEMCYNHLISYYTFIIAKCDTAPAPLGHNTVNCLCHGVSPTRR